MKTKILSILALLLTVTQGAWAQVGRVLATDGKYYKTVTAATNAGTTASGMIVYWGAAGSVETGNSTYRGMAISLVDAPQVGGTDIGATTGPWANGEEATTDVPGIENVGGSYPNAVAELKGIANTAYMMGSGWWPYAYKFAHHRAHSYAVAKPSGTSDWFEPTLGQWARMMDSFGGSFVSGDYDTKSATAVSNLNTALTNAGGTALSADQYWLSTEINNSEAAYFSASGGQFGYHGKATSHPVRAFFAFSGATAAEYTVNYNANGGSGAPDAQTKDGGIDLTLSSTVPTRTGYTFAGWNTQADGNGTPYAAGANYSANAAVTLYAQWTPTYTATFAAGNDNTGWTIDPASGVEGATVTASYPGENKVKSVTVQAKPICALSAVTSAHVGKVIGADGNVYNTVAQANTATTACGVIAYVGAAGEVHSAYAAHKGIAVSLDETLLAYSTVNEDLDSPTSTFATVLAWKNGEFTTNAAVAKGTYPAFTWAAGHNTTPGRVSGASAWFLPSVGQWNLAVRGMTGSDTDLKEGSSNANSDMDRDKLNVVLNAAGASPLGVGNYMMATEYSTTEFWEYIYLGYFDHMGKSAAFAVRPIFTF